MIKDEELKYWIDIFRKNTILEEKTFDVKKMNQYYDKSVEAFKEIKKLDSPEYNHFVDLLDDEEVSVQVSASWYLLGTKHHKKAKKTLETIVKKGPPMLGLRAEEMLNTWNEKNSWWAKMKERFSL